MNNRINKIFNLYKICNLNMEDNKPINLDFDEDYNSWNEISSLYNDINKLKIKWSNFYEQSGEVDSSKFSKNFEGFSKWIEKNIPEDMPFLDGVEFLIEKIINFIPSKKTKQLVRKPMSFNDKDYITVPIHMKEVAQPKEEQQPFDYNRWKEEISIVESRGNYKAINKHTNALGRYQFVPRIWWSKIQSFSGGKVKMDSYEDFLNNPQLQEDFMKYYTENNLLPSLKKFRLREKNDLPEAVLLSDGRLMALFHFQGARGAENWLKSGRMIGADINLSVSSYLTKIT